MSRRPPVPPALSAFETEVMEQVWRQGRITVRQVMLALNEPRRQDRAYTTYLTIMARLHRKGMLRRRRTGASDAYWPRVSREEYQDARARVEVGRLVDVFGDVALAHFAHHMSGLDPARLDELRREGKRVAAGASTSGRELRASRPSRLRSDPPGTDRGGHGKP